MSGRATNLAEHLENYNVENTALHRKLQTNVEAIRILRRELDKYRTERDQFKLMAETIQLRYSAMKSQQYPTSASDDFLDSSSAIKLLNDFREKNLKLSTELEKTKDKLQEKEGDIQVLRGEKRDLAMRLEEQKNSRNASSPTLQEAERQDFLSQMEKLKRTNAQLKFDMQVMLDEKFDLFSEIDAYKNKSRRLQDELESISHGKILERTEETAGIDKLKAENDQLKDRMRNMEKDLEMSTEIIVKYKKFIEAQRKDQMERRNISQDQNVEETTESLGQ